MRRRSALVPCECGYCKCDKKVSPRRRPRFCDYCEAGIHREHADGRLFAREEK